MISILRLGHRLPRDVRITTHCALVGRAFGATAFYYAGQHDQGIEKNVTQMNKRFGGSFSVIYLDHPITFVKEQKKEGVLILHLTMYGLAFQHVLKTITVKKQQNVLVIIGSEKVPPEYYQLADYNLSVGNQPHSEVAALALVLDRYFDGKEFDQSLSGGEYSILPTARGKNVVPSKEKPFKRGL